MTREIRYPVRMPIRYRSADSKPFIDAGQTIEMSSTRLVIETDQPLDAETKVQVSMAWPAALEDGTRLQLIVTGKVIGVAGTRLTIDIRRHEFRTRRRWETPASRESMMEAPLEFGAAAALCASAVS